MKRSISGSSTCRSKSGSVQVIPLHTEQLVAIFPADTPGVPRHVTPEFMARHKLLLEAARAQVKALILDWISPATRQLRPAMLLDNFDTIARMVVVGLGASIVPASVVENAPRRRDLIVRPLQPGLQRTLGLIMHKKKVLDRATRIFHDAVLGAKGRPGKPRSRRS